MAIMAETVTEFSICAAADGVVLNPIGRQNRAHESLHLLYGNGTIARTTLKKDAVGKLKCCKAYGIVGNSAISLPMQVTQADPMQVCSTWSLAPS